MRGGVRKGAGRKPGSKNRKTLLRMEIGEEALKAGKLPLEVMLQRMRELIAKPDAASRKEACLIASWAAPYVHARLSTQNVTTELKTQHVIRVPEKSSSIDAWLETYGALATPPKTDEVN